MKVLKTVGFCTLLLIASLIVVKIPDSLLYGSIQRRDYNQAKIAIRLGANIEKREMNRTQLIFACERGDVQTVRFLLQVGAKVDGSDENGVTPLMIAAGEGYSDIVELLIGSGADVNAQTNLGKSILYSADEYPKIVEMLKASGAN